MDFTVRIPTKPHIRKYLKVLYGHQCRLSKNNSFGLMVLDLLDKKIEKPTKNTSDLHSYYTIVVPEAYSNRAGFNIGTNKKKFLALFFEKQFNEDLRRFVDMEVARRSSALEAMRTFLNFHAITVNEINLESVYRSYQRYCKDGIKRKKK